MIFTVKLNQEIGLFWQEIVSVIIVPLLLWCQVLLEQQVGAILFLFFDLFRSFLKFCITRVLILLEKILSNFKVLWTSAWLPDSNSKSCHFSVGGYHLLSVSAEKILLNTEELWPHKKGILIGACLFEVTCKNADHFFEERMVFVSFCVSDLFLECLRQLKLNPVCDLFRRLRWLHHHNCV